MHGPRRVTQCVWQPAAGTRLRTPPLSASSRAPATSTATRNPSRSYPRPMMQRISRRARCIGPLHALPSSQPPPSPRRAKPRPNKYSVSQATFLQRQQSQETDRARSIHSQRSTGGSAPVESISSAAERQQAVSRPPFCSRRFSTVIRGGPLGPMRPPRALAPLPSCTSCACPSFFGL